MSPGRGLGAGRLAAGALLAGLTALWGIWAWRQGAYFETAFFPGLATLVGLAVLLLIFGPQTVPLRGPARVGFWALLGLAGLTLISVLWTPTRGAPLQDAQHVFAYAVAFLVGVWLCQLLGRRMELALLPVTLAAGAVGLLTLIVIWTGTDVTEYLTTDGTLRWPLGYRNAVAASFMIAFWPAVVLASRGEQDWRLRGAMLAIATLSLELAILCQSRGSLVAAVVGLIAYVVLSDRRWKALAYLALATIPAAIALPWLLDVFTTVDAGGDALSVLRPAARAIAATSALALLAGWLAARTEPRLRIHPETAARAHRAGVAAVAVLALIGSIAVARSIGDPIDWVSQRTSELKAGTPDLGSQGSRFGINAGSNRGDFWRVAWSEGRDRPLLGEGSGGFQVVYLRDRDGSETPADPHSVEMLMFSELGLPGLALFVLVCAGLGAGALGARRLGPYAAALTTGTVTAAAYWLAHASIDWFWNYPALTAPVFFLLGAACAPALLDPEAVKGRGVRYLLVAALVVALALAVPVYLSERYTENANAEWRSDLPAAYDDLGRARSLNPLDDKPALAEAVIARAAGDPLRAISAAREVVDRQPDSWAGHLLLGELLAPADPTLARTELERAAELNPDDPRASAALGQLAD